MRNTPKGVPYEELFENTLKKLSPEKFQVERFDDKMRIWSVLEKSSGEFFFFYGYDLGINDSNVDTLCKDKYLSWMLLTEKMGEYSSPLEMRFFNGYNRSKITFKRPLSSDVYDLLNEQKSVVLKPNTGSGGSSVYKVEDKYQADRALRDLSLGNSFISTKFIPVSKEHRIIMIRNLEKVEFLLCLEKKPLKVRGDGKSTIEELVERKISELREGVEVGSIWEDVKVQLNRHNLKLEEVLLEGFELDITWRLNQVMGAETNLISEIDIPKEVMDLAKKVFITLNMNFGCVDIVEYKEEEKVNYLVMEVNTEVLTDLFDHFEEEDLVRLVEESINMRSHQLKYSKDVGKVNFADLKTIKPEEENIISTYNERASAKRKSIEASCKKLGFPVKFYSQDYLGVIGDNIFIIEFDIGLNKSTAISICSDKGVTTKVLSSLGIPSVEHQMFSVLSEDDTMENIIKKAKEWDMNVVVKKRWGSSGSGLYHVKDEIELERKVFQQMRRGMVLSPYLDIIDEYRVLVLKDEPLCIYKKKRMFVLGDGRSSLFQLILNQIKQVKLRDRIIKNLLDVEDLNKVINEGEKYMISWKHNLDQGAVPELSEDEEVNERLLDIATRSIKAIGMNYAAVDIVETSDGKLQVLEINSTPTFYNFIQLWGGEKFEIVLEKLISAKVSQNQHLGIWQDEIQQLETKVEIPPKKK